MMSKKDKFAFLCKKCFVLFLQALNIVLQLGLFIWLYSLMPVNRIETIISYIIISPIILWALKKVFHTMSFGKLYMISLFISNVVLCSAIMLVSHFRIVKLSSELLDYISTLLFAILVYYVFGSEHGNKIYDVKTIKNSYAYTYFFISQNYNFYFIKTLVFAFYTFTLLFGQLRDLGIHNSSLFKYEQYAIILIIAIDRIINSFNKEFPRLKEYLESKRVKEKEEFINLLNDKVKEIKEQYALLLKVNPKYDIENLDFWDNANNPEHPQTKLLYLYLMFNVLAKDSGERIDELFKLTGRSVKESNDTI